MESKNEIDTWSNWTQTNFKHIRIFQKWNKNRFINYHLKFFKYRNLNFILQYEIGAKLMLYAIKNISIREIREYKILRTCITCQNLIFNPNEIDNNCLEILKQDMSEESWNSHKINLLNAINSTQPFDIIDYLKKIIEQNLASLEINERILRILRAIWSEDKRLRLYLKIIHQDIYINNSTYKSAEMF